jgi:hypothetical protein
MLRGAGFIEQSEVSVSASTTSGFWGRISKRAGLVVALAIAGTAAFASIASAATVSQAGATITYQAVAGETNSVVVTDPTATSYLFTETGILAGTGCTQTSVNSVTCTNASTNVSVVMNMDDMGDTVTASGVNQAADTFQINGEAGDDILTGTTQAATINGGSGNDTATGNNGIDTINGDAGNDNLNGANAADTINGGDDNDVIFGGQGNSIDTMNGGNGNDIEQGDDGNDLLNGDAGNDVLDPGPDGGGGTSNVVDGGTGIDRLTEGAFTTTPPAPIQVYACTAQVDVITLDNTATDSLCSNAGSDTNNVKDTVESVTGSTLGDTITGSCFANTFAGSIGTANGATDGNDTFNGDPTAGCATGSSDFMGGGEGNDTFNGDGAIDNATTFAGFDTVTYGSPYTGAVTSAACAVSAVNYAVRVTLDDVANDCDGFGNVTDNVNGDIERVVGSGANDYIDATAADQDVQLFGGLGDDFMIDSTFNDLLNGQDGTDTANCPNGGTNVSLNNEAGSCTT